MATIANAESGASVRAKLNATGLYKRTQSTSDPDGDFDDTAGYEVGSTHLNTSTGVEWSCTDASTGAAVWENPEGVAWGDPVDADIVPDGDGTRDLGSSSARFAITYTDDLDLDGFSLSDAQLRKNDWDIASAPTVDEDSGDGFGIGSFALDVSGATPYLLRDDSPGAADWLAIATHDWVNALIPGEEPVSDASPEEVIDGTDGLMTLEAMRLLMTASTFTSGSGNTTKTFDYTSTAQDGACLFRVVVTGNFNAAITIAAFPSGLKIDGYAEVVRSGTGTGEPSFVEDANTSLVDGYTVDLPAGDGSQICVRIRSDGTTNWVGPQIVEDDTT